MSKIKKYIFVSSLIIILSSTQIFAHDPIYGHGPDVLFKGGLALGFTLKSGLGFLQNEYELGYGINSKWTISTTLPFSNEAGSYDLGGIGIKSKYRFYVDYNKGSMIEFAAIGSYEYSKDNFTPDVLNIGLASGRESVEWYWFASVLYTGKITNYFLKPGDEINYDLTFGYRLNQINYYKPDYVIFIEFIGKHQFSTKINDSDIAKSGGNSWAIAPTLMFTYRNYALRAGVEFGLGESDYIKRPETNFKVSIEMHI